MNALSNAQMRERKKLLIVNSNLHIGGVQKAVAALLTNIGDDYDVTLLPFYIGGACLRELPDNVRVEEVNSAFRYLGMNRSDVKSLKDKLLRGFYAGLTRVFGRKYAIALMGLGQKKITGYDYAISYIQNGNDKAFYGGCNEFVARHVEAEKKISFLHGDYLHCGANTKLNAALYKAFDAVAACSQGCGDSFLAALPEYGDKLHIVKNCQRYDAVRAWAEKTETGLAPDKINIVTVARLGKEKSVWRAVEAMAKLGSLREKIHYYIIGDGIEKDRICSIIDAAKLDDTITLCGSMDEPYGYIKAADLLLIPSISEAAPMVIGEAACLGTPVLSTETSSTKEMIEDTGYGWVCENSVEGIRKGLEMLISEPDKLIGKQKFLSTLHFDDSEAAGQFKAMLNRL